MTQYIFRGAALAGLEPGRRGAWQLAELDPDPFCDSAETRGEDDARSRKKLLQA